MSGTSPLPPAPRPSASLASAAPAPDDTLLAGWLPALASAIEALGTPAFQAALTRSLNAIVPVDHCVVFTFAPGDGPGHLFTQSKMPPEHAESLARDYVERFHGADPNRARILADDARHDDAPIRLVPHMDAPADYRDHFFDRTGLVDKASTIGRAGDARVYCNFYRMRESGPYSDADWQRLEAILPVATALIGTHYRLWRDTGAPDASPATAPSLIHSVIGRQLPPFDRLTRRERDICERILLGYSTVGIGLDLDIAPSSVTTYRRRAYEKLGISTQNQLFQLCLGTVQAERG